MYNPVRLLMLCLTIVSVSAVPYSDAVAAEHFYDLRYKAQILPQEGKIRVEMHLSGERLPSEIVLAIDPQRYKAFTSTDSLQVTSNSVTWQPRGKFAKLTYEFVVNSERGREHYDSFMTSDWAIFRGDRLVPRARVTARRNMQSRAVLEFVLPPGWSALTPYERTAGEPRVIDDKSRRFDRPEGWMIAGRLGTRSETIAGIHTIIASPESENVRRQDALAFLNWNLPQLASVFKSSMPGRVLIVSAGDPMWRGGLSAPGSLFLHADRPLISENRTSTLLHELVHVAMGINGGHDSDWIVEGFAEFYSMEILRRSGGISQIRYDDAMQKLGAWGARAPDLFVEHSSGAVTARAVTVLRNVDIDIRKATANRASLDDVARELAQAKGEVSLELLQAVAAKVAGHRVAVLERAALMKR
jgi:predicted metalloprotease with PDZ domain